ncbi:radical SAM protein [Sedimentitalea sp. HM32M-2]|uniref:radical SAM protein n=1 Tax=Sedimentitalea sp. HM32M-2 TaxID=3351566 RepID=UPI003640C833
MKDLGIPPANQGKFQDRHVTADGQTRASVVLQDPQTLWFNTGTLCNIECANCYILSSPTNDALVYLTADEVEPYLDQIAERSWPVAEIGFTGGEPFMNPQMIEMAGLALARGFRVLILTNAMRPMMRAPMRDGLLALHKAHGDRLSLRVSLDHYDADLHDRERGAGSFEKTLQGMVWLRDHGFDMAVAGRAVNARDEADSRTGYAAFFAQHGFDIDAYDPGQTVLFPEMDDGVEVPEITTACWDILGKSPRDVMCASSRMVVKRKGAAHPVVLACTLLPYAPEFELGETLAQAEGAVHLNHPHCAKFCVLGGASCSV